MTPGFNVRFIYLAFSDCALYAVGKPVYHRFTDQIYGCWMRDSNPPTAKDSEKFWVTTDKPDDNYKLYEYENKAMFRKDMPSRSASNQPTSICRKIRLLFFRNYTLDSGFQGNAHVIYNGSFYYNVKNTLSIIKLDLHSNRTERLDVPNLKPNASLKPLYQTAHNYMDFCVDDNGLWVVFGIPDSNNTGVMKVSVPFFDWKEERMQRNAFSVRI